MPSQQSPITQSALAARLTILLAIITLIAVACTTPPPGVPSATEPTETVESQEPTAASAFVPFPTLTPALVTFPSLTPTLAQLPSVVPTGPSTLSPTLTPGAPPPTVTKGPSTAPPVVQMVYPVTNTQISLNQTIYVVGYASSDSAVSRIELFENGISVRAENAPFQLSTFSTVFPWSTTITGTHQLRLVAYDINNTASIPDDATVLVTPDARRPTATIVFPIGTPEVQLGSLLQIYTIGTDESGVTQLDLWVDNQLYTYVMTQNPVGQPSLQNIFAWTPPSTGMHTLVVRAHDTQDQTTDSAPLKVFVSDTHSPTVGISVDRTNLLAGESISVTVTALDVSGIQRLELWTGREISGTVSSGNAARQTALSVQFPWQSGNPGDYALVARAYNADGNVKESAIQVVSVLRAGQPTPTRPPLPTPTRTRTPRPTATPRLQPPPPPSVEISEPRDRFAGVSPLRVVVGARGNAELQRVELWGYTLGQPNPQLICTLDAKATTVKVGQCDWPVSTAGAVFLFAQAIDIYGQVGRSALVSGVITPPGLPTPTPTPVSLAARWTGTMPTGLYSITFRPITTASGTALRGDVRLTTTATPPADIVGRVSSGLVKGNTLTFHIEFTPLVAATPTSGPDTPTPLPVPTATPAAPAFDFECTVDASGTTLDCKYKDVRGQTGPVQFKRDASP